MPASVWLHPTEPAAVAYRQREHHAEYARPAIERIATRGRLSAWFARIRSAGNQTVPGWQAEGVNDGEAGGMAMRLVAWTPVDLARRLDDVVTVYGEAMGYLPEMLDARRGYIATHVRRPGFRAVATVAGDGQLAGFGYGYTSGPGQWWHDQVRGALAEPDRTWLTDCFEVVELHVRPAAQGRGLGARQLRALLDGAPGSRTLLSTPEADERTSRAWRLYRRFGFVDVLRDFHFPGDERAFAILGRGLPLDPPDRPDPNGTSTGAAADATTGTPADVPARSLADRPGGDARPGDGSDVPTG